MPVDLDENNARPFSYRDPRVAWPLSLHVELARSGSAETIAVRGIDISASGIAIAVSDEVALDDAAELAIRCGENELGRIPGRVFYPSENHFGLEFKFVTEEQRQRVQEMISTLIRTI